MKAIQKRQGLDMAIIELGLQAVEGSQYAAPARRYFSWSQEHGLGAGSAAALAAWRDELLERMAPASLTPYLAAAKRAILAAGRSLLSARDYAALAESLREVKAPKKASMAPRRSFSLTNSELRALQEGGTPRDRALISFLLRSGARISEAISIRLDRCRVEGSMANCEVLGKGSKIRSLRVPISTWEMVRAAYPGDEYLFSTASGKPVDRIAAWRRIHRIAERAIGKQLSPHSLRHIFASRAIERTGKIAAVSELLGHASVATTMSIYVHESISDAELEQIF